MKSDYWVTKVLSSASYETDKQNYKLSSVI